VPTAAEVTAIIAQTARERGFIGSRNRAFFTLLVQTGTRVNALREADTNAVICMPGGRLRLMVHAKGRAARREVEITEEAASLFSEYIAAFNLDMLKRGRSDRLGLGEPGPLWRSSTGAQWSYAAISKTFARACLSDGVRAYRLHAFRRAYATDAASVLPRYVVARAGGWQGVERLDNHYIRPRDEAILSKFLGGRVIDHSAAEAVGAAATL
jgi:site-specific recombinase XerD